MENTELENVGTKNCGSCIVQVTFTGYLQVIFKFC